MVKKILLLSIVSFSQISADDYFIKLGAFKMNDVLKDNMSNLPANLRNKIVIVKKSDGWLIPIVKSTYEKDALILLPKYQHYFKDAIVSKNSTTLSLPVVRRYQKEESDDASKLAQVPAPTISVSERKVVQKVEKKNLKTTKKETKAEVVSKPRIQRESYKNSQKLAYAPMKSSAYYQPPVEAFATPTSQYTTPIGKSEPMNENLPITQTIEEEENRNKVASNVIHNEYQQAIMVERGIDSPRIYPEDKTFSKELLSGRVFYLANKSEEKNSNLLVKATFENHRVNYTPIVGNMQIQEANFIVQDEKLYMFEDQIVGDSSYSSIESNEKEYLLVSSWSKNKKINTLRYYHNVEDAKKYLGLSSGNKLSSVLESGEFDHRFIKN